MVCRSVCLSATTVSPAEAAKPNVMPFGMLTRVGPRNYVLDGGSDPAHERTILRAKMGGPGHGRTCQAVDIRYSKRLSKEAVLVRYGCQLRCTRWGTRWRNLANTTEPSVCCSDTALCQITLTTCTLTTCLNFVALSCLRKGLESGTRKGG